MNMTSAEFGNVRVFDPIFTFVRAMDGGTHNEELHSMLGSLSHRRERGEPIPNAPFYRYASHIAVLMETGGKFYCCTYVNDEPHKVYDLQAEKEAVRTFFEESQGDLTVLDDVHYSELIPRFDVMERYVSGIMNARAAFEERRAYFDEYGAEIKRLSDALSVADADDPCCLYQCSVKLAQRNLLLMQELAKEIRAVNERELLSCYRPLEDPAVNLFGLYVYVLLYGLSNGRFIRRRVRVMSSMYRDVLQEMHAFMKEHDGIVERYCDVMQFPASEREVLIETLKGEGLYGDQWYRIGDDCFG